MCLGWVCANAMCFVEFQFHCDHDQPARHHPSTHHTHTYESQTHPDIVFDATWKWNRTSKNYIRNMYDLTRSRIRSTHIHAAICKARVIYELLPKFLRKILRTHIYCILYTRGIGYSLSSRQTSMAMDGRAAATPCSHHKNKLYGIFAFVFAFSFPPTASLWPPSRHCRKTTRTNKQQIHFCIYEMLEIHTYSWRLFHTSSAGINSAIAHLPKVRLARHVVVVVVAAWHDAASLHCILERMNSVQTKRVHRSYSKSSYAHCHI